MSEKIKKITLDTLIPVSLMISIVSAVIYGSFNFGQLSLKVEQHEKTLNNVATKADVEKLEKKLDDFITYNRGR